jgi:hypothetical protein
MAAVAVLVTILGFRAGRVGDDPAPRPHRRAEATAVAPESTATPARADLAPISAAGPVKVTSTALEVLGSKVPYATYRAVNSWFDYESAISDLSRSREYLGEETYRREVLRMTAEFLDLARDRIPALDATLRGAQDDLRRIQRDMGRVLAAYPPELSDRELRRIQSEVESQSRPEREAALARFDPFLDDSRERHREFRNYLERWVTRCCGLDP